MNYLNSTLFSNRFGSLNANFNEVLNGEGVISGFISNSIVFRMFNQSFELPIIHTIQQFYQNIFIMPSVMDSIVRVLFYLFSNYATGLILSYVFINRLIVMSSLRSNSTQIVLPIWSRWFLHVSAILPLFYLLLQSLVQIHFLELKFINVLSPDAYLPMTFALLLYSQCIEFLFNFTTNNSLLEKNDNSTLELSLQLYTMNASYSLFQKQHHGFISLDIDFLIIDRILVHIIEVLNLRKYRLLENSIVNIIQLLSLIYEAACYGVLSIPFYTLFKCSTKFISMFTITLIFSIQTMKWLIEYLCAPFVSLLFLNSDYKRNKSPAQLVKDLYKNLYYSSDQEFITFLYNLLLLTCNGGNAITEGNNKSIIFEGGKLLTCKNNDSEIISLPEYSRKGISGYLNELSSIPEDLILSKNKSTGNVFEKFNSKVISSSIITRIKMLATIFKKLVTSVLYFGYNNNKNLNHSSKIKRKKNMTSKDLNLYVTDKNYIRFLTRPADDINNKLEDYLMLPDEDVSRDFDIALFESLNQKFNKDKHIKYEYLEDDMEQLKEELAGIVIPNCDNNTDFSWMMPVWEGIENNERLTRAQFGAKYPIRVFEQTVIERRQICHTTNGITNKFNEYASDEDNDEEEFEILCQICAHNKRSIVFWPCKCFACCDECREVLGHKGLQKCFSCNSDVFGYSTLHTV